VIASLRQLSVAVTLPVVLPVKEYTTFAVGGVMSPVHERCKKSSALFIISITYHLISRLLGIEISFIIPSALSSCKWWI